ncbi:MAG: transcription antitermination factor NusB [Lachnospiraceae bacterium]|nr:transcription antitermination factor NusB [Lachnospiraceae bacterium]
MTRRKLREQIFKLLFRIEFNDISEMDEQCRLFFTVNDDAPNDKDEEYIRQKYEAILDKLSDIDAAINDRTKGWTTDRMSKVDLTIIRLGVYEILYDDDVPEGVAVNEAVELAKSFGQEESYSFVNGVLKNFIGQNG